MYELVIILIYIKGATKLLKWRSFFASQCSYYKQHRLNADCSRKSLCGFLHDNSLQYFRPPSHM